MLGILKRFSLRAPLVLPLHGRPGRKRARSVLPSDERSGTSQERGKMVHPCSGMCRTCETFKPGARSEFLAGWRVALRGALRQLQIRTISRALSTVWGGVGRFNALVASLNIKTITHRESRKASGLTRWLSLQVRRISAVLSTIQQSSRLGRGHMRLPQA